MGRRNHERQGPGPSVRHIWSNTDGNVDFAIVNRTRGDCAQQHTHAATPAESLATSTWRVKRANGGQGRSVEEVANPAHIIEDPLSYVLPGRCVFSPSSFHLVGNKPTVPTPPVSGAASPDTAEPDLEVPAVGPEGSSNMGIFAPPTDEVVNAPPVQPEFPSTPSPARSAPSAEETEFKSSASEVPVQFSPSSS